MADDLLEHFNIRQKYTHFRILVIGRANAGKTTLLQRVCNTTEDPRIYNEGKNLRGIHDINHPFAFESNPQFIFHDSRGFESGDESQLKEVQAFIEERARSTEPKLQLHAIWSAVQSISKLLLVLTTHAGSALCQTNHGLYSSWRRDSLMSNGLETVFKRGSSREQNRQSALNVLKDKFEKPLCGYKYPPKAYLHLEKMQEDEGKHQDQVKELIEKTADSLDNLALQMLFVSVQSSNLELCIEYAIKQ
ncbi:hypothetical protein CVT25_008526 [Psilocybe cyanescens]|uniref:Uncharacterized protein n=1 Tax=Psilocybe cyanescens TaxID=93625 RepID=A0A409XNN1_PSICY|nr:hypothetical protein CVT25_008526 [Psilocybe cyanescens]